VCTPRDLLLLAPRGLEAVGPRLPIAEARLRVGERVTVHGVVAGRRFHRRGRRSVLRVLVDDESGRIDALFFNQPWVRERFVRGESIELEGRVAGGERPALSVPRVGTAERPLPSPGTLEPLYPRAEGLPATLLRRLCAEAAERWADALVDPLPAQALARTALLPLPAAARALHAPASQGEFEQARRRAALEPLLALQARLRARREARGGDALAAETGERAHAARLARLPHAPTTGQVRVLADLATDLARTVPMRRLLQGDVGTGKTMCALYAALAVADAGGQTAVLAPTELLAEQHFHGVRECFEAAGLPAALLTGSLSAGARRAAERALAEGSAAVAFGTHALFSGGVRYHRLALAVVDEQHRFGVSQRRALFEKGRDVHALLMSATPIPRTLALTLYGDLDTSVLRERPPGRGRVTTSCVGEGRGEKRGAMRLLEERLAAGEGVFWVCPRIETTPGGRGAEEAAAALAASSLGVRGVALVHGRLPAAERADRVAAFRAGEVGLLVGTTVLEVGVDVPRATVMVVEGAERLGLAQLHQLRGRVGRGGGDAWCLLLGARGIRSRLQLLEETDDGFRIAEEDLAARGMGDLAGLRQAGGNSEGLGEVPDLSTLLTARELVADDRVFAAYR
jgi:ATP-dependent DNA helicase RecG